MKRLLAINFNKNLVKKGLIFALALAVVIGISYLGSQDYPNRSITDTSIVDMPMGTCGDLDIYDSLQKAMDAQGIDDFEKDTSRKPNPKYDKMGNTELKKKLEAQDPGTWKKVYKYGTKAGRCGCGFDLHYFKNTKNGHVFDLKEVNN
ncbi:hypothetical protein ES702_05237 [subsurface metagenome]